MTRPSVVPASADKARAEISSPFGKASAVVALPIVKASVSPKRDRVNGTQEVLSCWAIQSSWAELAGLSSAPAPAPNKPSSQVPPARLSPTRAWAMARMSAPASRPRLARYSVKASWLAKCCSRIAAACAG